MDPFLSRIIGLVATPVPVNATSYQLPTEVKLEETLDGWVLAWRRGGRRKQVGASNEQLLAEFMSLQDSEPDQIAEFASEWGALQLCKHGKPQSHLPWRLWTELDELEAAPCDVNRAYPGGWRREPISRWNHYSSQAGAIRRLGRNLSSGNSISIVDLEPMEDLFPPYFLDRTIPGISEPISEPPEFTRQDHERVLATALHSWLGMGDVGFHVNWREGKSSVQFGGTGLFGALALQLTLVCTGAGALFLCSECRLPYIPEQQPRSGERNYCLDCRDKGIPARNRQRALRARLRAERKSEM